MKIAYFGCDLFMQCLDILRSHGHEIVTIFAAGSANNNNQLTGFAAKHDIQLISEKPDRQKIQQLENIGVELFFSIEYDSLIALPSSQVMTMNVHPAMLPDGRAPTSLSRLILQYPQHAGITFHKLADKFDAGDIILQSPIQLDATEGLESLLVKLHLKIAQMLNELLSDLPRFYQQASIQTEGSYWPALTDQDRLLNWHNPISEIQKLIRAFGRFGVVCCIGQEIWLVNHLETFVTPHSTAPGSVLVNDAKTCVVATVDGIVIIYTDSIIERSLIT